MSSVQSSILFATGAASGSSDPNFSSVVFLWEAEGTNGQTSSLTEAKNGRAITTSGTGQISTAQSRFGGSSYSLGTGGANMGTANADWSIGNSNSAPWTLEFSVYQTTLAQFEIFQVWNGSGVQNSWWFRLQGDGNFRLLGSSTGSTTFTLDTTTTGVTMANATWADICIEKNSSGKIRVYKSGTMAWSGTPANSAFWDSTGATLNFGANGNPNGYLDHIRFTKGVARYNSDAGYTFVNSAFPTS